MIAGSYDAIRKSRKLRREMTLPEVLLWEQLRAKKTGFKFRRQHAAGDYILDFFCSHAKLAVEVDGSAHDSIRAADYDSERTYYLAQKGIEVMRISARDVLENIEGVVLYIRNFAMMRAPLHHPAYSPFSHSGEKL